MNVNPEDSAMMVALHEDGRSLRYIAERFNRHASTVLRVIRRYEETGSNKRRPGQGRKRKTTRNKDRYVVTNSLRKRTSNARELRDRLLETHNINVTTQTVRNRLKENNLRPRRPALTPMFTVEHKRARLRFAQEHLNWGAEDWRRVLFTDETRVTLYGSDRRVRVYRRRGERFAECNLVPDKKFGGGSIMVWAGISLENRTNLVRINGNLTGIR